MACSHLIISASLRLALVSEAQKENGSALCCKYAHAHLTKK